MLERSPNTQNHPALVLTRQKISNRLPGERSAADRPDVRCWTTFRDSAEPERDGLDSEHYPVEAPVGVCTLPSAQPRCTGASGTLTGSSRQSTMPDLLRRPAVCLTQGFSLPR
ncbi:hypothetical protein [Nocardia amamiensis]|uniref:hypothetical protein n=1 Tax=Nocardia TaxID=1817 RepID=UPI0033C65F1F